MSVGVEEPTRFSYFKVGQLIIRLPLVRGSHTPVSLTSYTLILRKKSVLDRCAFDVKCFYEAEQ